MEQLKIEIGKKIENLRKNTKISQSELGVLIGVTHASISKRESGLQDLSATEIFLLAKHFGVSCGYFFDEEEKKDMLSDEEGDMLALYRECQPQQRLEVFRFLLRATKIDQTRG